MGATVDTANAVNIKALNPVNKNDGADVIYITAAGYRRYPFRCATSDSDLGWNEPIWGSELTRSTNFVLSNILNVDYGLVARIEITYAYMNIADYKVLCKISKERVCYVTYFNRETAEWVVDQEFAFTNQSLRKLYAFGESYFGALEITISLVATNRDKIGQINKIHDITFSLNGGSGSVNTLVSAQWGDAVSMPDGTYTKKGYKFDGWQLRGRPDTYYKPGGAVTVWGNMDFEARWIS